MAVPFVDGTVLTAADLHTALVVKRVRVATTAAGTLATSFENGDTVDGVVLATGDRILIKSQSAGAENGIYTVNGSGAPTRALDFDSSAESLASTLVVVAEGTLNADKAFMLTTNAPITLGTTALTFAAWPSVGVAAHATANVDTSETTTSTTYTDLTTAGPAVTVVTGTKALVMVRGGLDQSVGTGVPRMAFAVSGATTRVAADSEALGTYGVAGGTPTGYVAASQFVLVTGLTAGSNTFTAKYRTTAGTGRFENRGIYVIDMGS